MTEECSWSEIAGAFKVKAQESGCWVVLTELFVSSLIKIIVSIFQVLEMVFCAKEELEISYKIWSFHFSRR